jgi:hypothetical protein
MRARLATFFTVAASMAMLGLSEECVKAEGLLA